MEVDHVRRLRDGGSNDRSNLRMVCRKPCHREKTRYENTDPSIRDGKRDWRRFMARQEAKHVLKGVGA